MCVRAVWVALLLVGGALPLSAGDHIDLDKPEPERIFLDNPWGGSPVVSSEVGAEPQAIGDPETMNPVYGTCQQPGIVPSECTADCAFNCETPECSLGCFCGCNAEARATSTEILLQMKRRSRVLQHQRQMQALASQHGSSALDRAHKVSSQEDSGDTVVGGDANFWERSLRALKKDEKLARRAEIKLQFQKKAEQRKKNPRYVAYQKMLENRSKRSKAYSGRGFQHAHVDGHGHLLSADRDPFAEADGFSWDKFHPVNPYRKRGAAEKRGRSPYEQEVGTIDDVFDPAEDWDNVGSDDAFDKSTSWWNVQANQPASALATADDWWRHEPDGFGAGRPNPFGSYDNDRALGWF